MAEETIQYLEDRLKDNPKSLLFARLADFYLKQGHINEAIQLCQKGVKYHPAYPAGNYILAKAYLAMGDHESAEAEFKNAISIDREYLSAYKHLGDMMAKMGWENKAAMYYKDLLDLDPLEKEAREMLETFALEDQSPGEIILESKREPAEVADEISLDLGEEWSEEIDEVFKESKDIQEEEPETYSLEALDLDIEKDSVATSEISDLVIEEETETSQEEFIDTESIEDEEPEGGELFGESISDAVKETPSEEILTETEIEEVVLPDLEFSEEAFQKPPSEKTAVTTEEDEEGGIEFSEENIGELTESGIQSPPEETQENEALLTEETENLEFLAETPLISDEEPEEIGEIHPPAGEGIEEYPLESADEEPSVIREKQTPLTMREDIQETDSEGIGKPAVSREELPEEKKEEVKPLSQTKSMEAFSKTGRESGESIVSPTLGEIYAAQGQYAKAITVYRTLLEKNPDDDRFEKKIKELEKKLKDSS